MNKLLIFGLTVIFYFPALSEDKKLNCIISNKSKVKDLRKFKIKKLNLDVYIRERYCIAKKDNEYGDRLGEHRVEVFHNYLKKPYILSSETGYYKNDKLELEHTSKYSLAKLKGRELPIIQVFTETVGDFEYYHELLIKKNKVKEILSYAYDDWHPAAINKNDSFLSFTSYPRLSYKLNGIPRDDFEASSKKCGPYKVLISDYLYNEKKEKYELSKQLCK